MRQDKEGPPQFQEQLEAAGESWRLSLIGRDKRAQKKRGAEGANLMAYWTCHSVLTPFSGRRPGKSNLG
jgi:hypothetical protein